MGDTSIGIGDHPYTVNFISFHGHGLIHENGDSLAVIPQSKDG